MSSCGSLDDVGVSETCASGAMAADSIQTWITHPDPLVRRNRRQAVETFPIIAALLAADADIPNPKGIETAIDHGHPLVEVLSLILGIRKSTVRCLRGTSSSLPGPDLLERPAELFAALESLSPEKTPRSESDWRRFREFWVGCAQLESCEQVLSLSRVDGSDTLTRHVFSGLCSASCETSTKLLRGELGDGEASWLVVREYLDFVTVWLESGAGICEMNDCLRDLARGTLRDEFLVRYSAVELIRQSVRWRKESERRSADSTNAERSSELHEWPPLPGLPLRVGDRVVVALTNAYELRMEGMRLDHCIAAYFEDCLLGYSHILSIRTSGGQSLSTAEVLLGLDGHGNLIPEVLQHRAHGNGEPSAGCEKALEAVLGLLGSSEMRGKLRDIEEFHAMRHEEVEALLQNEKADYPVELMTRMMRRVLHDADKALAWLDRRLAEEEGWYRHRNDQVGERFERLGFEGELTWERAMEAYLATGNAESLDEGIGLFRERHWRDSLGGGKDRYGLATEGVNQSSR